MAVPNFPNLSKKPEKESYRKRRLFDPVVRSDFENGAYLTHVTQTRVPWQWWFTYRDLPQADVDLLEAFEGTTVQGGAGVFAWTNPVTNVAHTCRLAAPLEIQLEPDMANVYRVACHLVEAIGTFT
jgi:hypothetical protein